jgi:predicted DCC family thiol-disulfide oxidoreductase YuxK
LIKRDRRNVFRFASLQSEPAQTLLKRHQLEFDQFDSIVVIKEGRVYERSDAVMILAHSLGYPWKLIAAGKVLPRFLRDGLYNLIARYRYRIFGRTESCMIPDPALKERFLG